MLPVVIFICVISAGAGIGLYFSITIKNKIFNDLNDKLSLTYQKRTLFKWRPSLSGQINNHEVTITEKLQRVDDSSELWTFGTVRLSVNGIPHFNFYKETFISSISNLFGVKESSIGDDYLNKKFYFLSDDPKFFIKIFDDELKNKLKQITSKFKGDIHLNRGTITVSYQDSLAQSDQRGQFLAMFAFTLILAERINKYYTKN